MITYAPIVLLRRGEQRALSALTDDLSSSIMPMFVIPPVKWDFENDRPEMSVEAALRPLTERLILGWGRPAFLDTQMLGEHSVFSHPSPLTWLTRQVASAGMQVVPVVTPTTLIGTADWLAAQWKGPVCIRVPVSADVETWDDVAATLSAVSRPPDQAHLVFDLGDEISAENGRWVARELMQLPDVNDWLSLTVASSAIPPESPAGPGVHEIARRDWRLHLALHAAETQLPRKPIHADYLVQGASAGPSIDPKLLSISAMLRYTGESLYWYSRGGLYKSSSAESLGALAVPAAAAALLSAIEVPSGHSCTYETWIRRVAAGEISGSNPEKWREMATIHHLTVLAEQLSS